MLQPVNNKLRRQYCENRLTWTITDILDKVVDTADVKTHTESIGQMIFRPLTKRNALNADGNKNAPSPDRSKSDELSSMRFLMAMETSISAS